MVKMTLVILSLSVTNSVILILLIILHVISLTQSDVQLYNTEDSPSLEFYDCIHYIDDSTVKYCRRPGMVTDLSRHHQSCSTVSERMTYADLQRLNVSPNEVLMWSSSVEKADDYAAYLLGQSFLLNTGSTFLCNCSDPSTFGKFCEYQLFFNSQSFYETISTQFQLKSKDIYSSQIYGNILCYTTLECNYGLLCLDWRNICDGAQNCMDGVDEVNCDILEFNECEDDEYRCVNGQCIPDEYWMDGKVFSIVETLRF